MEEENVILMMKNNINDLNFFGIRDKASRRKTFFTTTLLNLINDIQKKVFGENIDNSGSLQGQGLKNILNSNIFDIYTRLQILP